MIVARTHRYIRNYIMEVKRARMGGKLDCHFLNKKVWSKNKRLCVAIDNSAKNARTEIIIKNNCAYTEFYPNSRIGPQLRFHVTLDLIAFGNVQMK